MFFVFVRRLEVDQPLRNWPSNPKTECWSRLTQTKAGRVALEFRVGKYVGMTGRSVASERSANKSLPRCLLGIRKQGY